MKKTKNIGSLIVSNLLLLVALTLWILVVIFSYAVIRGGGHLFPRAEDGQSLGTLVEGSVKKGDGEIIGGAKITVYDEQKRRVYITSEKGAFLVQNLLEGTYRITVEKQGLKVLETELVVGNTASAQNFILRK